MDTQRKRVPNVIPNRVNMILSPILVCCSFLFYVSCWAGEFAAEISDNSSTKRLPLCLPALYVRAHPIDWEHGFQEGLGEVELNGKWGFINPLGAVVIEPRFDGVSSFHGGLAIVRSGAILKTREAVYVGLGGNCWYIDKNGQAVHKIEGRPFSEGLAVVRTKGKLETILTGKAEFGFIDRKGKMAISQKYSRVESFSEGLARFEDPNGKFGYINAKGEVVIKPHYFWASDFSEGLAEVSVDSAKSGYINKRGEIVIDSQYDYAQLFSEGFAAVGDKPSSKWGYIDRAGKQVIPFKFDDAKPFSEGYAAVETVGRIGYINANGQYVIRPQFERPLYQSKGMKYRAPLSPFSEGLAAVISGAKWGYVNKKGDFVIEPKFDWAGQFTEGFAKVAVGDKMGYIDKQGKYIWEPTR